MLLGHSRQESAAEIDRDNEYGGAEHEFRYEEAPAPWDAMERRWRGFWPGRVISQPLRPADFSCDAPKPLEARWVPC
jgi:hypothetical protein